MRQRLPPGHLPPKHQAALLRGKVGAAWWRLCPAGHELKHDGYRLAQISVLAMAAVAPARYSLANGISDPKSERTTDQKRHHNIRHDQLIV
jgi:hypothetical protein